MTAKITRQILESFINCPYKGYLQICGEQGIEADYGRWQARKHKRWLRCASDSALHGL